MRHLLRLVVVASLTLTAGTNISRAQGLDWQIAPYFWMPDVSLDTTINGDPALGTTVPFSDLVDKLEGALMLHAEMRGPRFGAFLDIISMKLSDSGITPVGPGGPILGDLLTDTTLKMGLFEIGGLYRFGEAAPGSVAIDVLLGIRQVEVDQNILITLPGPAGTELNPIINVSETDFVMGGRVRGMFNDRWGYRARADYGVGGTDGTLNLLASVGYTFGDSGLFTLDIGYRHLKMELSQGLGNGVATASDITFSGPIVGLIFSF